MKATEGNSPALGAWPDLLPPDPGRSDRERQGFLVVSGRRTYADIITSAVNRANEDNPDFFQIPDYFFYDLNAKVNYELGPNDQLFLSGYFGRDRFLFEDDDFNFNFDWGIPTERCAGTTSSARICL